MEEMEDLWLVLQDVWDNLPAMLLLQFGHKNQNINWISISFLIIHFILLMLMFSDMP